ncbi:MAG: acetyl-CoA carboxylase biotin carboxyl carrier protein [Bacillota bacterium]
MDIKNIRDLVKLMEHGNLRVLQIEEGDTRIRMERDGAASPQPEAAKERPAAAKRPAQEREMPSQSASDGVVDFNNIVEVKSPMVGVFYAAPAPDAKPFVAVGSKVKKGDVLCIVEAMKLMNEITADTDGEIVDICVENGQVVEFAQVLFRIF